jgi:hypothetical protein
MKMYRFIAVVNLLAAILLPSVYSDMEGWKGFLVGFATSLCAVFAVSYTIKAAKVKE